jgi:probable selenium-dependent hydroxylase accessory protein YqeC
MNRCADQTTVFRAKEFQEITGIKPGEKIVPESVFTLFIHPKGLFRGTPPSAQKRVFLNRLDLLSDRGLAFRLAGLIAGAEPHIDRIVIGSTKTNAYHVEGREWKRYIPA